MLERLPPGAAPAWLPPDVSRLLPEVPSRSRRGSSRRSIQDEPELRIRGPTGAEPPPEAKVVTVDETLTFDASAALPALLRQARREWFGLCWMCWAVGLDRVALPDGVDAPADFGQAAGLSIERLWRCRDRIVTGGLRAMTQGVPNARWEGVEIDVPARRPRAEMIAADEYREMRAIFYWLCDEGVQSPWQDNVRAPD